MSDPVSDGRGTPPPPGWQPPPTGPPSSPGYPSYPSYPGGPVNPGPPPPGYPGYGGYPTQPPPPAAWAPAPGMLGAAHKPGAMPLRPLGLGDIYDAAFRIIRFNPRATVGSAVLVAAIAMAIPVVVTAILTATLDFSLDESGDSGDTLVGAVGSVGSLGLGAVLASFGTILVTGMIAHVTAAAAIGRRLTLGQAWAATHGNRWRLIGLALLLGLAVLLVTGIYVLTWVPVVLGAGDHWGWILAWGLVTVPIFLVFMVWFWIRVYYLPVPALMLERIGVFGAIRRGFVLTRKQFWRTLGIALLTLVIVQVASSVLAIPIGLVGQIGALAAGPRYALLVIVITQALAQVLAAAFVTPFTSAVTSLQYLDQRMRKEAYDVELMQQAGLTTS